jgi:hydroxypyruvate isomerase
MLLAESGITIAMDPISLLSILNDPFLQETVTSELNNKIKKIKYFINLLLYH